jgi:glucosyl-dolichyl phosphate glucuronosyltransferase
VSGLAPEELVSAGRQGVTDHESHLQVSVIVCAYTLDRWDQTRAAVASVLSQSPPPAEVLVVVDHNPHLAALCRDEMQGVRVIESAEPRGLSGARNTGLAAATRPVAVFLDDDAEARPGWLAALVAPYQRPEVVATGGGVQPRWQVSRPGWLPPEFDWVVGCSYLGLPESAGPVRNPIGANMSVRTQLALDAGGFNATIGRVGTRPRGCEETELAIRLTAAKEGAEVIYVPDAAVDHHVPAERARVGYFVRRCWHEGQSKAAVVRLVGSSSGLERERRQAVLVIPAALLRDLRGLLGGDASRGKRMAASIAGLGASAAGYVLGLARLSAGARIRADRPR